MVLVAAMFRIGRTLFILAAVLFLHGAPDLARADEAPRFEPAECWSRIYSPRKVDCGYLVVPELRARPEGPTIRLPVAIFRTEFSDHLADPLIMVTGGPGGAFGFDGQGVNDWNRIISQTTALERREVILIEQRGAGLSEPNLD
jgi:pimeloyl-ACP methyl ester carboxylesterase